MNVLTEGPWKRAGSAFKVQKRGGLDELSRYGRFVHAFVNRFGCVAS